MEHNELKMVIKEAVNEAIVEKKAEKLTLTLEECVKLSGIGRNAIDQLVHAENSDFPYFRVGRKVLINREKLILWLDRISEEKRII
ncbi:excisionase [Clostridium acetobutylicum]|nr:excisionase [Clostridium acetobutylicum]